MLTALEAVSKRASTPQEDSDSFFFLKPPGGLQDTVIEDQAGFKVSNDKLVYEAKCLEAGHTEHWGESNGEQLTSL